MEEKICQLALSKVVRLGPQTMQRFMTKFKSCSAVFNASFKELTSVSNDEQILRQILHKETFKDAEKEFAVCQKNKTQILFYTEPEYPQRLNQIKGMPSLLFFTGNFDLNHHRMVSIVGTRTPTREGLELCSALVEGLKAYNANTISGLAYGIDARCHHASLEHEIPTIGVMGQGHHYVYPQEHMPLVQRMQKNLGGTLTEHFSHVEAKREFFPMRNKIVAALCDVLIVVESKTRGGSLITAEFANQYGKDVFAVPGNPKDENSKGCNALIKQHKAHLLESVQDIEYVMRWDKKTQVVQQKLFPEISIQEREIVDFIGSEKPKHIDEIAAHLSYSSSELAAILLNLELKGIVNSKPGKHYLCKK